MKHYKILPFLWLTTAHIFLLHDKTVASPIIEVDSQNVDIGKIKEGSVTKIRHVFVVKNKGDDTLIISKVRAS